MTMAYLATQWTIQPALPPMQVGVAALVLTALAIVAYARTWRQRPLAATLLGAMRLVAVALLAALLLGPSSVPEAGDDEQHHPIVGVLLDTSASMQREDAPDGGSRFAFLSDRWLNDDQLAAFDRDFELRLMGFDTDVRTLSPDLLRQPAAEAARGETTFYADVLRTTLLDLDRAAGGRPGDTAAELIVLGDGHDTHNASLASAISFARDRQIPVHSVAIGSQDSPPNVAVVAMPRQDFLLAEEEGELIVEVHQGGLDDASVTVNIQAEAGGERIERTIDFAGRRSATVTVPIEHAEPGLYAYDVSIDPLPEQILTEQNHHRTFVEVLEGGMRVLILEGEPYWDTRFLAQSLRRDARMQVTQITQLSAQRREGIVTRADAEATVPIGADGFADYDVVILGRRVDAVLDEPGLEGLAEWVLDRGGQLVLSRGRPYDLTSNAGRRAAEILQAIEPVTWHDDLVRNVPLSLTAAGRSSPLFSMPGLTADLDDAFATLPPMRVVYGTDSIRPAAVPLVQLGPGRRVGQDAAASTDPAMVMMNVGGGRVLAVLGEGLWRWRLLPPELAEYEGIFDAFWSNAVRYLAAGGDFQPGEDVSLQLGRSIVQAGDPLTLDVVLRHAPPDGFAPTITLTGPGGQTQQIAPTARPDMRHRYRASVELDDPGVWEATLHADPLHPAEQSQPFSVYRINQELLRSEARHDVLRDLAEETGGLFFDAAEPVDLAEQLERRRRSQQVPPTPEYIWDQGLILLLLVVWLGLEWIGRRRSGWL